MSTEFLRPFEEAWLHRKVYVAILQSALGACGRSNRWPMNSVLAPHSVSGLSSMKIQTISWVTKNGGLIT